MKKNTIFALIILCLLVVTSLTMVGTLAKWKSEKTAIQSVEVPGESWNPSLPYLVFVGIDAQDRIIENSTDFSNINSFAVVGYTGTVAEVDIPSVVEVSYDGMTISAEVHKIYAGQVNGFYFQNGTVYTGDNSEIDFKGNQIITSLYIPKVVGSIGDSVFMGCINLESIELEKSNESIHIGDYAFQHCLSLESVNVSERSISGFQQLIFHNTPYGNSF